MRLRASLLQVVRFLPGVRMQTLGNLPLNLEIHCQPLSCKVSSLLLPCIQDCSGAGIYKPVWPLASNSSITWEPAGNVPSQPPSPPYLSPRWHEHGRSQPLLTSSSTQARGQLEGGSHGLSKLTQLKDRDGFALLLCWG